MRFEADAIERLDKFLARMLPQHSRTKIKKLLDEEGATVNGASRLPAFKLQPGDVVEVGEIPTTPPHDDDPVPMELDVLFEDEEVLVLNKPRGLAVHPAPSQKAPTLVNGLLARPHGLSRAAGGWRPGIVHRLDKDTTGLMVVAKNDVAHFALAKQFSSKTAERRYAAVVRGDLQRERLTVDAPIGRSPNSPIKMAVVADGKPAVTHVKRLGRCDSGTVVACRLETGRTHQIRVHLAGIGHSVLGDHLYAPPEFQSCPMQLHAALLAFDHPASGERIVFFAPPPEDFLGSAFLSRADLEVW